MKNGFPQRNNSMNTVKWRYGAKESGSVQTVTAFYFMLFLSILLYSQFQVFSFRASGMYLEDALAASNLAAAVADIEEYGVSHRVCRILPRRMAHRRKRLHGQADHAGGHPRAARELAISVFARRRGRMIAWEVFYAFTSGAMLMMSALGLESAIVTPSLDRQSKRFFVAFFAFDQHSQ